MRKSGVENPLALRVLKVALFDNCQAPENGFVWPRAPIPGGHGEVAQRVEAKAATRGKISRVFRPPEWGRRNRLL